MIKKIGKDIADCVSIFECSVMEYYKLLMDGSEEADHHYFRFIRALRQLNEYGEEGLSALATLMDHNDHNVRVAAASYLIHRYPDKAIKILTKAAEAERPNGGLAIVTLKRWELGRYLDPASGKEVKFVQRSQK